MSHYVTINIMEKGKCAMSMIAKILVIVGGLNWGLVGVGMFMNQPINLVSMIFGSMPKVEALVYVVVGLAAVGMLIGCKCAKCKSCNVDQAAQVKV